MLFDNQVCARFALWIWDILQDIRYTTIKHFTNTVEVLKINAICELII